ncbi:MAG: HyaD/HybD family hydrogenase maturation endopeptidase [Nitrospinae bacterium]|nr:HyaD/HybD family hydrogenase maturation endopeptidase [Nitrospinota bacterium]
MTLSPFITILGIGNLLLCDEGVGVRVIEKLLAEYEFPPNVNLVDGGATGLYLLPYIEESTHVIVVDAVDGPGEPGTLYRYSAEDFKRVIPKKMSIHDVGFVECLALAELDDALPKTVTIIGVKPHDIKTYTMELSSLIKSRLEDLTAMALDELKKLGVVPVQKAKVNIL